MLKYIKNLYKKLLKSKYYRIFDIYKGSAYASQADYWKEYFFNNQEETLLELENLKKGLDKQNRELVDLIFDRFVYLIPWTRYLGATYFYTKGLWTEQELTERKKKLNRTKLSKKYKLPKGESTILIGTLFNHVFLYDYGLKFLPQKVLLTLKDKDFIDCGAHIGDTALLFSKYTNKKIYAFEPNTENYKVLLETIKLNKAETKIIPVKFGAGKKEQEIKLYGGSVFASVFKEHLQVHNFNKIECEKVKITTIDKFVQDNNLAPGLIKMDIEGYELEAALGAIETIKKFKPILIISVYHHPKDFFKIKPLVESLNSGYKFMFKKLEPNHFVSETVLIGYVDV